MLCERERENTLLRSLFLFVQLSPSSSFFSRALSRSEEDRLGPDYYTDRKGTVRGRE